ncbi:hypothetical protein [Paraburkholderia phenoliruptrix]|uniref:hypothetical protein n=1 Tax=Paraburkholderia phenoliruptrix TaxID=252970 RepID=UPI003D975D05
MKLLSAVVLALSLSASFAARAQSVAAPQTDVQQTAQADTPRATHERMPLHHTTRPATDANACVGPNSFCNIFFGS